MFSLKYLPHKKPNEKIVFFLRRHWAVVVRMVFVYLFLAVVPPVFYWLDQGSDPWMLVGGMRIIFNLLLFSYYLFWWMMLYYSWLDYFLDVWIVTNMRVIHIEQRGLFNRFVAEHKLFRIQDVASEQKGIIPTLLNYGRIDVQTAGTEQTVTFRQVPNPHKVAQELVKLIEWRKRIVATQEQGKVDKVEGLEGGS